jgi:polar amino acid transport system substrate-binding protein
MRSVFKTWLMALSLGGLGSLSLVPAAASQTPVAAVADAPAATPRPLRIAGERWAPFNNYANDRVRPGFMLEIVAAILRKAQREWVYTELPWARAMQETRLGRFDALIGADKVGAAGFDFPSEPIGYSVSRFFVRADSTWRYRGVDSLSGLRIGVLTGTMHGAEFDDYAAKHRRSVDAISGPDYVRRSFVKLATGRIDAFLEDSTVAESFLRGSGQVGKFKEAGRLSAGTEVHLAFAPGRADSRELAALIDDGVRQLRRSGELQAILSRYGVTDWAR